MIIYIDEAGRWPIAGPVSVGAVFLCNSKLDLSEYDDSKKLSVNNRVRLYSNIQKLGDIQDIIFANAFASAKEIDRNGIVWAIRFGIIRTLYSISKYIYPQKYIWCYIKKVHKWINYQESIWDPIRLIIDGNSNFGLRKYLGIWVETVIKWDSLIKAIAMASIIAKVSRDQYMIDISDIYPDYWFAKHKWYGTQFHYDMIAKFWLSDLHRKTWIR